MTLSLPEIMKRADALYAAREQPEEVRASVRLLEDQSAPLDYEILWRLGRALFFLGQESTGRDDARFLHERAVTFCARAVGLAPARVEGHFWLGVNQALLAQGSSLLRAALLVLQARRSLRQAARLDPAHHAAGPLRVLAHLEAHLPLVLGGSTERARAHFEQAIRLAPANTVNRIYFAELLMKIGETPRALEQLEAILHTAPNPAWAFETARDKRLASEMLKDMNENKT